MKTTMSMILAGLALALSTTPVLAFGRGAAVRTTAVGPAGGVRTTGAVGGVATGPLGGVHAGVVRGSSYTGPGGGSIQRVGGAGVGRGPVGVGGVAVRPVEGVRVGGVSGAVVRTPVGGVAVGGGVRYGAVGHRTTYYSPAVIRSSAVAIRGVHYPYFTPTWYRGHGNAWIAPRWVPGYNYWLPPVWGSLAAFVGLTAPPIYYDYGGTFVIQDNNVYQNGDLIAGAEAYALQAAQLADAGRVAKLIDNDEWQPLGVFGMVNQDERSAQRIFQLAVDRAGIIRGNYYDAVADTNLPIFGSIDRRTQRVAWSIGDKTNIVFETGLANLLRGESTVLIHNDRTATQEMILVRLDQPKE